MARFYISVDDMAGRYRESERDPKTGKYRDVVIFADNADEAKEIYCRTRGIDKDAEWLYKAYDADKADAKQAEQDAFLKENGYSSWHEYEMDYKSAHPSRPIEL